ncbi:beta strand repeat-containing protein [Neobacillus sp. NPDC093127]|uniref:beta strand repeat-containing protein n=1 Tax=Neobacillus sp. NPDC093127 TaxID=3364296 RepID=UPI0038148E68
MKFKRKIRTLLLCFSLIFPSFVSTFTPVAHAAGDWTPHYTEDQRSLRNVAYGGGKWLATSHYGVYTSSDGDNWNQSNSPIAGYQAIYSENQWIGVGDAVSNIATSADGITWTTRLSGACTSLLSIASNGQRLIAVGTDGCIVTSTDNGVNWLPIKSGTTEHLTRVVYGNNKFVAMGDNGFYVSSDGISWMKTSYYTTDMLLRLTYGNGLFVAVGYPGKILTSPDGVTWTQRSTPIAEVLYGVTYGAGKFVAVGDAGVIKSSPDGKTWSYERNPVYPGETFNNVNFGDGKFVTVGYRGQILTQQFTLSTNANLSNLTTNQGVMSPSFAASTTSYTVNVPYNTNNIGVTPTTANSKATVTVNGKSATSGLTTTFPLNVGPNVITIIVKAQDGTTQKTYTITVTRNLSNNANLNSLFINNGTLSPAFNSETTSYTVSVPYDVKNMAFTPTVAGDFATVKVNGISVLSGTASTPINLGTGDNTITIVVTAQDGSTKTYTVVVKRAKSSNADLSNLTISNGTLSPAFNSGTTSYTVSVPNDVKDLAFTPTVAGDFATVTVNGKSVESGSSSTPINLGTGDNTITIVVTAQDGSTKTYTVVVKRAKSSNADLSNLTISNGTLSPAFNSGTTRYTVSVPNDVKNMAFTPTAADDFATVTVNGKSVESGSASTPINLGTGDNTITIVVTAQDGSTKTYTVVVKRAKSSNADLSNLLISDGTLSPTFSSGTTGYTVSVNYDVKDMAITPTVAGDFATVTVNGLGVESGSASNPINLGTGDNTITIVVTAQDGTTKTYTVVVKRAKSSNADLSNLTISNGTLSPAFNSGTTSYTVSVLNDVKNMAFTPTVAGDFATVKVNGMSVESGSASTPINLGTGDNTITIVVTAQDGSTKTYTVVVKRAKSSNANLSNLTISNGTLSPAFNSGTTSYSVSVNYDVKDMAITPTVAGDFATVTVNGRGVESESVSSPINLDTGDNTITIVVTAQDGTTKTYTVVVKRAKSSNADLSNLTISNGTLSPAFNSGTASYTVSVPNDVKDMAFTPTAAGDFATVKVNGISVLSGTASTPINLGTGDNTITIVVTAQDGTTKTYTVVVKRAKSSNADLSKLTISNGTLSPAFNSGTTSYTVNVPNDVKNMAFTPTVAGDFATVTVNGRGVESGSASSPINLDTGDNTITIVITAQDGTTKTYTVVVKRAKSSNADLSNLTISNGTLSPDFNSGTTSYTVSVPNDVKNMAFIPTVSGDFAKVTVNGRGVESGSASNPINLGTGDNTITIVVTAQDGTTKTYNITVNRAKSSNADLSKLTIGNVSIPFEPAKTDYNLNVGNETTNFDLSVTLADDTATVEINGEPVLNGKAVIPLKVGKNTITILVTAQDGTTKIYSIHVTRAANPEDSQSHNGSNGKKTVDKGKQHSLPNTASSQYDLLLLGFLLTLSGYTLYFVSRKRIMK